jgi:hypothetical protein
MGDDAVCIKSVMSPSEITTEAGLRQMDFAVPVVVCAWCKPKRGAAQLPAVSHGICPRHLRMMKEKVEEKAKR